MSEVYDTVGELDLAVVDVETTGFAAQGADRIVEIAVVRLSAEGERLDEFETLVNPQRDVGPTKIHGISALDVREAPLFADVAGDVAARMQGAVFVAHNAEFDRRFVSAEYARLGYDIDPAPCLCTMRLSGLVGLEGRRLEVCCSECGVPLGHHHSALHDARAAADLLVALLRRGGLSQRDVLSRFHGVPPAPTAWPALGCGGRRLSRSQSASCRETPNSYMAALVRRVSAAGLGGSEDLAPYLELLDRVLEDREVTRDEVEGLHEMALAIGLTGRQVVEAHWQYMEALAGLAWADGVLTGNEAADLRHVGSLLGLDAEMTQWIVEQSAAGGAASATTLSAPSLVGKSVCFTGQLARVERGEAERRVQRAGLVVKSGVSKKLDILVCADPHSQSVKARKARELGVRIMAEEAFWRALGGDERSGPALT